MPIKIVLLSGPVCAGKTSLAKELAREYAEYGILHQKTLDFLRALDPTAESERGSLQALGELYDRRTGGAWVRDGVEQVIRSRKLADNSIVILDAVRIEGQVDGIRRAYGPQVLHIHLTAPVEVLAKRYKQSKRSDIRELPSYDDVLANKTESQVEDLKGIADILINTQQNTLADVVARAASHIGLHGRQYDRLVDVIVGGQYGSEGKGQLAAYLASDYDVLVRVGGPNAGHSVFEDPKPYVFHQLPSGTRASAARLVIGPGALIHVPTLLREIADCSVEYERLSIDPQAMVITDADINEEEVLQATIGSTGRGVGSATARKIRGRSDGQTMLARDVPEFKPFIRDTWGILERAFFNQQRVLLEGTQGTGLSLHHGSYPHVTSRDTTVAGCLAEAGISPSRVRKVIMVCRTYPIRVESPATDGCTSGPMSQEISWQEISRRSGIPHSELKKHEVTSTTHRSRRVGEFDWALLRKAASLNAPTDISLTFVDYLSIKNREARRFDQLQPDTIRFVGEVERVAAAPVSLISTRFHFRSIIDRRSW